MAVVSCHEIWNGRSMKLGERWQRSYQRIFRVQVDTMTDGQIEIIQGANGIPLLYSHYVNASLTEFDLLALCNDISAVNEDEDPFFWKVTCSYSTRTFDPKLLSKTEGQDTSNTGPLSRAPEVQWSLVQFTKPLDFDRGSPTIYEGDPDGNPITVVGADGIPRPLKRGATADGGPINPRAFASSSFEPFDPPYEIQVSELVLNYRRNEAVIDPTIFLLYQDAVNTDPFLPDPTTGLGGIAPGLVKVQNIGAMRKFESNTIFWEVNYEFHIRAEGWYVTALDQGYTSWPKAQSNWTVLSDTNNVQSPTPRLLDGKGNLLTQGANPAYLIFFPYKELPFAPLGIT